ncbi:MAG: DNA polymerase Y family protein [Gammaproteobacteria bacterium]
MLWLCLYFPQLPLEIHTRAQAGSSPWAITHGKGTRQTILLCNAAAASCGIRPGMAPGAALALSAALQLRPRDDRAERQALGSLAAWAGQFTSLVSLLPPQALLLEIEGSLSFFRGLEALLRRVDRRTAQLGYVSQSGVAPTPLGALTQILEGLGLRSLGDVLRLPRAGLARRFGPALLDTVDRLLGRRADPREPYVPPPRFERQLLLPVETCEREALLFPARRLLLELAGFLIARQAGTQQLQWTFSHHRRPATHITLGLAAASRDASHLLKLLRERLTRTALAHPVEAIVLRVTDLRPLHPRALRLDGAQDAQAEDWPQLVETLRARLGDAAVRGLQCFPDHRPEQAWRSAPPDAPGPLLPPLMRPLWLLPEPVALKSREGVPYLDERLTIETGPERLESGWWDGGDMARDYFVASDGTHSRYWIFQERHGARRWFLHGLFA